ncbi:hypothetical protein [Desulfobacca acetoxidans]|uniref:Uncharacterized protein n=1 Tax=Desulfobacca acetoxidans (strain ATCC 700848 / DSM 11109 / ASRB2) TaxID=880072 RepID=F2NJN3_DESAR|nr:hypothetical protein [Desulfobacca acetoxidans]AEB09688.1 hypothetical protein Desac_1849 [Desulfobacca acetoxidans DSM 11109]
MREQEKVDFGPLGEKLAGMIGAARDAFNRHSLAGLDQFKNLQEAAVKNIAAALEKLDASMSRASAADKIQLARSHSLLTRLQLMTEALGGLREPIEKKVKNSVLFSEKAVAQTNALFDQQSGLLRSVFDIIQTNNDFLKKFVQEESKKQVQNCADYATEHETRLIEGLCQPQAAPIFLAILDRFRTLAQQEVEITAAMSS